MPTVGTTRLLSVRMTLCLSVIILPAMFAQAQEWRLVGEWGSQGTGNGQFQSPYGIAVDANGRVFVADTNNHRIQKFEPDGTFVKAWGSLGTDPGQFNKPWDVAVSDTGRVYVADGENYRIQKFTSSGRYIGEWGTIGDQDGEGIWRGVAVSPSGRVYASDIRNRRVQKFSSSGQFLGKWGSQGHDSGQFWSGPKGLAVGPTDHVYVADWGNWRVQKFSAGGMHLGHWGSNGAGEGQFSYGPSAVAVDASGNVYVTDDYHVRKFDAHGGFIGYVASLGVDLDHPFGIAVDLAGRVHIADTYNHRILVYEPVRAGPDMMAKLSVDDGWSFNNVFGSAANQRLKASGTAGETVTFLLRMQNVSDQARTFRIYGSAFGGRWQIRFFDSTNTSGAKDITTKITGGSGWEVPDLEPRKSQYFRAEITVPDPVWGGDVGSSVVRAVAAGSGEADAVKLVVRAGTIYCADARIKRPEDARWEGNNVYNDDGWGQRAKCKVPVGSKATYHLSFQNDGNVETPLCISGPGSSARWKVRYYDGLSGGDDITLAVRAGGWVTAIVKPGKMQAMRLEVTPRDTLVAGDSQVHKVTATTSDGPGETDAVKAITTVKAESASVCQVTGLSSAPTAAGAQLTFSLSSPARVQARVLSIAGRPVKTICTGRECEAGTNTLVWNASSDQGTAVPNGAYLVEVTAMTEDGGAARALSQVRIAR